MGTLEAVVHAAENFALTYDMAMTGYRHPDAIEADLTSLEDAITAYRHAMASDVRTAEE